MNGFGSIKQKFANLSKGRRVAAVGVAALLLVPLGVGSTALFTSTDTASVFSNNGHVEITTTEKLSVGNILPGVPRSSDLVVDNSKSTAKVQLSISAVTPPSVKNPAGADFSEFTVKIVDSAGKVVYGPVAANALAAGPINVVVSEGQTWTGKAVWELAADAGNEYQDINVHYSSVSITGTQVLP